MERETNRLLAAIKDQGTWSSHLALLPRELQPQTPINKLVFVILGPPGAGKSTLGNTIIRTFSQAQDWTVFDNNARVDAAQGTRLFEFSRLDEDKDHLLIVDSIGLKDLDEKTALIWHKYLMGGRLEQGDIISLVKSKRPEIMDIWLHEQEEIPAPDVVIIAINADITAGCTALRASLKFIDSLKLAKIGYVVVITKVKQVIDHYDDPIVKRQFDSLRAELRQSAGPDDVFEVESYTNNTDNPREVPKTRNAIARIMYRALHNALIHKHRTKKLLKPKSKWSVCWYILIIIIIVIGFLVYKENENHFYSIKGKK